MLSNSRQVADETEGDAFFVRLRSSFPSAGFEFLLTNSEEEVVMRAELTQAASARSLCKCVVDVIKRYRPTSLIILDIDPPVS